MTVPFTYLVYHVPTQKAYYGVRYADGCDPSDLWVTYFTSSKRVQRLIDEYGKDSFRFEIRRRFSSKEKALLWEQTVLKRLNLRNGNWLNTMVQSNLFIVTSETIKDRWKDDSYRQAQIASQNKTWANNELRAIHSKKMKIVWTDERRSDASERAKFQWSSQDRDAIGKKISQSKANRTDPIKQKGSQVYHITFANNFVLTTNNVSATASELGTKRGTLWKAAKENRGIRSLDIVSIMIE